MSICTVGKIIKISMCMIVDNFSSVHATVLYLCFASLFQLHGFVEKYQGEVHVPGSYDTDACVM